MRKLNQFEKDILKNIISLREDDKPISMSSIFRNYLNEKGLKINTNGEQAFILFNPVVYGTNTGGLIIPNGKYIKEVYPLLVNIIRITSLLKILEEAGLINIISLSEIKADFEIKFFDQTNPIQLLIPEKKTSAILSNYLQRDILLTEDLLAYIKRGYRTTEDKRHHDTKVLSILGLIVAILLGLLKVDFGNNELMIKKEQFNEILNAWSYQNQKLDSLNSIIKINKIDTLNVKIKSSPLKVSQKKKMN